MQRHLLEIVERTTTYLEGKMRRPVDLDDVSRNVGVSKFHLLRIWKGATSTGIMEYVRRRRLALSLSELLRRSHTIDYVAAIYSFGSERAYNRAFKDEFGLTPTRWRRRPSALDILERFNVEYLARSGEGLVGVQATRALPAFWLAGAEMRGDSEEPTPIREGLRFFYERRKGIVNPIQRDVYLGLIGPATQGRRSYLAAIQVGPDSIVPPDLTTRVMGPFTYAVFRYMGLHDPRDIDPPRLGALWEHVYRTWRPTVPTASAAVFTFERIDFGRCSRQYCECDLYYPIRGLDTTGQEAAGEGL